MLQLGFLDQSVSWKLQTRRDLAPLSAMQPTVDIIDFKKELYFVVWCLTRELVHCIDELLEGNRSTVIFVKNLEHTLHEERLQYIIELVNQRRSRPNDKALSEYLENKSAKSFFLKA